MTDIHVVIAELKALEAKEEYTLADQLDMCDAMPHLLAYIEKLEAVASAAEDFRDASFLGAVNADDFRVRLESTLAALERDG